jgi:hypothetical protein
MQKRYNEDAQEQRCNFEGSDACDFCPHPHCLNAPDPDDIRHYSSDHHDQGDER